MLPCTIGNFNFYAMADLGASVNVLPRNIFEYLGLRNLIETEMLVEMADMRKKAPLGIVKDIHVKIDKFLFPSDFVEDSVWSKRYSEWCNKNSHDKKPRPRDYTFKEYVKLKKGHLDISKSVRKDLFRLWVIDKSTEALDPDEDPFGRCLDEYNWVFPKEIEQLADEYEIKIREKGQVLEEIWTKYKKARSKDKDWWYDYWYANEEKTELGNEDYNPPINPEAKRQFSRPARSMIIGNLAEIAAVTAQPLHFENHPSTHLVFAESELGKMELGEPGVD
ncbi:mutator type transposase [Tanacetum coccineum]